MTIQPASDRELCPYINLATEVTEHLQNTQFP
jgi:hypothetical protein